LDSKEIGEEGYIRTQDDWVGFLPRPIQSNPHTNANEANPILGRVFMLKDAKVPIVWGYSGKAVLSNAQALAMREWADKKKINLPFGKSVEIFWPINLRTLKELFPKSWNQAQVRALEKKKELSGMLKGKKYFGNESYKPLIFGVSIILALGIILVLISVLFLK